MSKTTQKNYKSLIVIPRKWGLLPTLDMYILREFLIKLSILVLVFVILFILSDVFNDLDNFLEGKSPMSDFFTYLLLKLPGNVRFVMPIAMLPLGYPAENARPSRLHADRIPMEDMVSYL